MTLESLRRRCKDFPWASTKRAKTIDGKPAREVVIGFFSSLNSEKDAKMGGTALECSAVVQALNHFRAYIWGRPVTVVTDAAALRWLLALTALGNDANGKLLRWAMRIQEYDVHVVHRPGKQNNADGPSRLPQILSTY
jgi:RNase H-like domain found in reverse transcriptase